MDYYNGLYHNIMISIVLIIHWVWIISWYQIMATNDIMILFTPNGLSIPLFFIERFAIEKEYILNNREVCYG